MPVIAAGTGWSPLGRRGATAAGAIGIAAALSVATFSNSWVGKGLRDGLNEAVGGVKTVAAMLAERSPGERPEGALANLKPKRQTALHERALPKVRGPAPGAYEALVGPPPAIPIIPLPPGPLAPAVAGVTPVTPITGGTGGPPILSEIPFPGGGGGGFISPPVAQSTPETPPTPVTPVPEPTSWAMMMIGLVLMAHALRRRAASGAEISVQ